MHKNISKCSTAGHRMCTSRLCLMNVAHTTPLKQNNAAQLEWMEGCQSKVYIDRLVFPGSNSAVHSNLERWWLFITIALLFSFPLGGNKRGRWGGKWKSARVHGLGGCKNDCSQSDIDTRHAKPLYSNNSDKEESRQKDFEGLLLLKCTTTVGSCYTVEYC